jgi:allantoate deiminase
MKILRIAEEAVGRCRVLSALSETPGRTTRTFLSTPMHECHREISSWMEQLGMRVDVDSAGNLRGRYLATNSGASALLIGSHIDTVPNAGPYDGVLGVMIALALIDVLDGRRLPFDIEIIAFSEEEGVRFKLPFIGSRAVAGTLIESELSTPDASGITIEQAIRNFGLDPGRLSEARIRSEAFAFVEYHIEQGPVLDKANLALAVVDAIVGQSRLDVVFSGKSNHAGTTPMNLRADALAGTAEWIGLVEETARATDGLVATVGRLEVRPGAVNVIPGEVQMSLDVRHPVDEVRLSKVEYLLKSADAIAKRRGLTARWQERLSQPAVKMDARLVESAERSLIAAGQVPRRMTSGAGHDAMILSGRIPSVMFFLRSPGGVSHHPDESVRVEDVATAIRSGLCLLNELSTMYN